MPDPSSPIPVEIPTTQVSCRVNGAEISRTVPVDTPLLAFLRDVLGLTGTKGACLEGECGSCTVLVDGVTVNSCLMLAAQANDRNITTIEGLAVGSELDVIQDSFIETGAAQCGYCTPGLIMSARALLNDQPDISEDELLTAMEGNICRCTGYASIIQAVKRAHRESQSP
ncbi:MAG: (2Fe-2S)-binding protein [Planctomycetes bacterium]|nr:(2Fe-2S)-binding protein [Planctomycetota bacterium]